MYCTWCVGERRHSGWAIVSRPTVTFRPWRERTRSLLDPVIGAATPAASEASVAHAQSAFVAVCSCRQASASCGARPTALCQPTDTPLTPPTACRCPAAAPPHHHQPENVLIDAQVRAVTRLSSAWSTATRNGVSAEAHACARCGATGSHRDATALCLCTLYFDGGRV